MTRFAILLGIAVLAVGLLACSGSSQPAVPTLPLLATSAAPGSQQQPAPASQSQPPVAEEALNAAVNVPQQLRGEEPPPPPWPTFTPGPKPQSKHRLLYARTHKFHTVNADGSDSQPLRFATKSPQLLTLSYKDPGRGWLAPNGRYLLYIAGQDAQLWLANLESLENVLLAERMIPAGEEGDKNLIRSLVDQEMAWTGDSTRVALLGAPDNLDLFIADVSAAQITRVTRDALRESRPRWSPEGRYLAYMASDQATGAQALYIVDAGNQQAVEVDMSPVREAAGLDPDAPVLFAGRFAWVNDRQLLFYPRTRAEAKSSVGIWSYDPTSGKAQPILTDPVADVAWSAEARAWVYTVPDDSGKLWLARLDDPRPTLLAEDQAYAPLWSPDGQSVLYSSGDPEGAGWDLRVVDLHGNTRTLAQDAALIQRETSQPGPTGKRYWSADGRLVLYTAVGRDYGRADSQQEGYGAEAGPDLENWWLMSANGGESRQATDLQKTFYLQKPALSPDGTTWAFTGFSYTDRVHHLYTMPRDGGHPVKVDAGVRWFKWLP